MPPSCCWPPRFSLSPRRTPRPNRSRASRANRARPPP
ncbi:MAG TPA: hypothetical protein DEB35_08710, partial [Desulfuromonas sp.]|nr:hypothetical protein [Desulfuromonas sp.]